MTLYGLVQGSDGPVYRAVRSGAPGAEIVLSGSTRVDTHEERPQRGRSESSYRTCCSPSTHFCGWGWSRSIEVVGGETEEPHVVRIEVREGSEPSVGKRGVEGGRP